MMGASSLLLLLLSLAAVDYAAAHYFNMSNMTRSPAAGTYGVDVSTAIDQSTFSCLKDNGFTFAIIRAYQSNGLILI